MMTSPSRGLHTVRANGGAKAAASITPADRPQINDVRRSLAQSVMTSPGAAGAQIYPSSEVEGESGRESIERRPRFGPPDRGPAATPLRAALQQREIFMQAKLSAPKSDERVGAIPDIIRLINS